jgi:hypothetical protein
MLRSIRIMVLGKNSRQIFGFKRLIRKVFRNKDLSCQRRLKMVLGAASRCVVNGRTLKLPQSELHLLTLAGCKSTNFFVSQIIVAVDEIHNSRNCRNRTIIMDCISSSSLCCALLSIGRQELLGHEGLEFCWRCVLRVTRFQGSHVSGVQGGAHFKY